MDALTALASTYKCGPPLVDALREAVPMPVRDAVAAAALALLTEVADKTAAKGKENGAPAPLTSLAGAAGVLPGLACTAPHGTFDAAFFPRDKLVLRSAPKAAGAAVREAVVPVGAVRAIAVLESVPEDAGAVMVLIRIADGVVTWGKQALTVIAIRLPREAEVDAPFGDGRLTGNKAVALCSALGHLGVPPSAFHAPDPAAFRAAGGGQAVGAAVGAQQGYLFPMPRALAFVKKPAVLVCLDDVAAAELRRADAPSSTFDLAIHSKTGGKPVEFGAVPRAELGGLRAWLEAARVPVGAGSDGTAKKARPSAAAAQDGGDVQEEGEFKVEDGAVKAEGGGGDGASAAAPATAATAADDDSDADSDFDPGSGPSSDGDRSSLTSDGSGGSGSGGSGSGRGASGNGDSDGADSGSDGGRAVKRARGDGE